MAEKMKSIDQRIKENIKNYNLNNLLLPQNLKAKLESLAALSGAEFYVTDRHGKKIFTIGDFGDFIPDVVNRPGVKIRVANRTIGHIYAKYDKVEEERKPAVNEAIKQEVAMLSSLAEQSYLHKEYAFFADELEEKLTQGAYGTRQVEKEDLLTGVFNQTYFMNRMRVVDRSEVVPVALIQGKINDSTFVSEHYGEMESDRLISIVAMFLKEEAKPEYIIGRCENDIFEILIAAPEEGEAEEYCRRVQERCLAFEDALLAPSVAFGIVYKQNVEESLSDLVSDAEYVMFESKLEMKKEPGYEERLKKGIQ